LGAIGGQGKSINCTSFFKQISEGDSDTLRHVWWMPLKSVYPPGGDA